MKHEINAIEDDRRRELAALVDKYSSGEGIHATAVDGLFCIRLSEPNLRLPSVYQPSICVIVQGAKQVLLEEEIYRYAPPQFLAVSVDLPLLGQVIEASTAQPYLCLQIEIDPRQIGELMAQSNDAPCSRGETATRLVRRHAGWSDSGSGVEARAAARNAKRYSGAGPDDAAGSFTIAC